MIGRSARLLLTVGLVAAGMVVLPAAPAVAAVDPVDNPTIEKECGLDVTLVLDASGSVSQSHAVENVRDAGQSFLSALQDTNSTARVIQFATVSEELAGRELIDAASMASGGALGSAISGYYDPKPPVGGYTVKSLQKNADPTRESSWSNSSSDQYTNWHQTLKQTATDVPKLVVFITDGDPTAYDFDRAGDPFYPSTKPAVGIQTTNSSQGSQITIDRAVEAANAVKTQGSRILTVGVGSALNNPDSLERLQQVSGPNVARTADEFDITTTDVALVPNFDNLEEAIRAVVLDLCSPSLTIRKLAQSATSSAYLPAQGWDFTTTPTVPGGFAWVQPAGATAPSQTVSTDINGYAQFQWEPTDPNATSTATISEAVQDGFEAGRDGDDFVCTAKDDSNNTRVVTGELDTSSGDPFFELDPIGNEIVTCTVWNSFDYQPAINVTKVNDPTVVRGDLDPAPLVTSTYQVTNPGNTALRQVSVTDDQCGPATPVPTTGPNQGDTNRNGQLDPPDPANPSGETWIFTCDRSITGGGGIEPETIDNTGTASGFDPAGTLVTDTADADVTVYTPEITLTKLVNGVKDLTITRSAPVTYTYAATNTGNTPLGSVNLDDNTPPCTEPNRAPVHDGDTILDVGETWNYTCAAAPIESVLNTATVTGTPLDPTDNTAFPDPNPTVSATDYARVQVVDPGLSLTKTVDENLVFPGTEVTYTYAAENTGDVDLRNDTGDPGWVADPNCSPIEYSSGDDGDGLLNPGETWIFTCSKPIDGPTINIGTIVAQPVDGNGNPAGGVLTRRDVALVRVLTPDIAVTKESTNPVVLEPDASAVAGPDVPTRRPATFVYEVSNTGNSPLTTVTVTDDKCPSVTPIPASGPNVGDINDDGLLDVDEVWSYECSAVLDGADLGQQSLVVENTVTASGTGILPGTDTTGPTVTDTATADTVVIHPGLEITKTASQDVVRADRPVTYTIEVRNTGDVPLSLAGLNDTKCSPLEYVGGDANDNGLIEGQNTLDLSQPNPDKVVPTTPETFTYTCTRTLGLPPPPLTEDRNQVAVIAIDPLGNGYTADATAVVHVIDPAINLVKSVSNSLVPAGTTVTYGFDVTNVGLSPIPAEDVLDKVSLTDVADPAVPECRTPTLVSKTGGNDDDLLDREPAETWRYECQAPITDPTTDVAIVLANAGTTIAGVEPFPVLDFDVAFVQPFTPAITVEKSADPTELGDGGGPVTYTYLVRNTGDVPLADVASRITDDTCSPVSYVSGDDDGDGLLDTPTSIFEDALDETWVFTCTTTVTGTTTNTVVVTGSPSDPDGNPLCGPDSEGGFPPCDTSGTAEAVVEVAAPPGPTPPGPDGKLPDTGTSGIGTMLTTGAIALMLGGLLVALARRRQLR